MPTLPVAVVSVTPAGAELVAVVLGMADGTRHTMLIPQSSATVEAVRFSAIATAQLLDLPVNRVSGSNGRHHWRYDPRP